MRSGAIDIHYQYVPAEVAGEAKHPSKALGVEVTHEGDGTVQVSFNGGARYRCYSCCKV